MAEPGTGVERVVLESTPSIIARAVRTAIADGRLEPGSRLGEARLARELGVSRGPLREAMQRLTQEGLLVSVRNRGLFVAHLTDADVRDVYAARTVVERAAAAAILAGGNPAAAAARLGEVTEVMASAPGADGSDGEDAVGQADVEFHELLVQLAGSPRLARMHATLLTETRMCIHALRTTYRRPDDRVAEHRAIAEALGAGDAPAVDRLLVEHMRDALTRLVPAGPAPRAVG